jgi:metal-sulfur cluster biosynthetic enzyme
LQADARAASEEVLSALRRIIDPDFGEDIVSCGFVKSLNIDAVSGAVTFTLELTTPACPVKDQFKREATQYVQVRPQQRMHRAGVLAWAFGQLSTAVGQSCWQQKLFVAYRWPACTRPISGRSCWPAADKCRPWSCGNRVFPARHACLAPNVYSVHPVALTCRWCVTGAALGEQCGREHQQPARQGHHSR